MRGIQWVIRKGVKTRWLTPRGWTVAAGGGSLHGRRGGAGWRDYYWLGKREGATGAGWGREKVRLVLVGEERRRDWLGKRGSNAKEKGEGRRRRVTALA